MCSMGLVYGVQMGVAGPKKDMAVLMNLNHNGQAITLSKKLADKGAVDGPSLAKLMATEKREYTFAQTFPTGTHAMWLYYWLATHGHQPDEGRQGHHRAAAADGGQHAGGQHGRLLRGRALEPPRHHRRHRHHRHHHPGRVERPPEKALGTTGEFVKKYPNTCRAVIMAILEASRWIDASLSNKNKMADTIAEKAYVNTSVDAINQRILGRYQNGLGKTWDDPNHMKFFNDGAVNFPYLSDGMWFLTQHKRWGLLKDHPDYLAVAKQVNQIGALHPGRRALKVSVPKDPMRSVEADRRRGLGRQGPEEIRRRLQGPRLTPDQAGPALHARSLAQPLPGDPHGQCRFPLPAGQPQPG